MKYYDEPAKKLPVAGTYDVIVSGGGPAGIGAAVSAARNGASTLLIEQCGTVGGVATSGLMSHWTGNTKGGIYEEILDLSCDHEVYKNNGAGRHTINPEKLKKVFLKMLADAGVTLRLYTFASDVIMNENEVKGVIIESKSGREAVFGKVVIDCTGDGDIAAKSGARYYTGREQDGKMQPVTLMFKVGGVNYDKGIFPGSFESKINIPAGEIQALGKENIPAPAGHVLLYKSTLPGVVTCNMTNCININGCDADDLTKATFICTEQIDIIVEFLRKYAPGYEECYLLHSAPLIGVRETRHFAGLYTLTEEDILNARVFSDRVVSRAHFNFDVHNITGSGLDESGSQKTFPQTEGYSIPYGCLVPEKIDNLLLAGRNISGTHMAHSNFRAMPICANLGQAAGVAASVCAKKGIHPRDVSIDEVQELLRKNGVEL